MRLTTWTIAVAALALLGGCSSGQRPQVATAQSGGSTAAASTLDPAEQADRWASCMREHGVTMAQTSGGAPVLDDAGLPRVDKEKTSTAVVTKASDACRALLPVVAPASTPLTADELDRLRRYAVCMRQHGIPEYPDPDPVTGSANATDALKNRDKYDPAVIAAMQACQPLLDNDSGTVGG